MGLFLSTLIVKDQPAEPIRDFLEHTEDAAEWDLDPSECDYQAAPGGTSVLLSEMCSGYDDLTQKLSSHLHAPVMMCYIYDDDFWGYFFFDDGKEVDRFSPIPDYFEELSKSEMHCWAGNAKLLSKYFGVAPDQIQNYLTHWTEDLFDAEEEVSAYPQDEYGIGDPWQMSDFMAALGFPYQWDNE